MRPELLQALPAWFPGDLLIPGGSSVHLLALVATLLLALRLVRRAGLDVLAAYWATVFGIVGAILGGRLWAIWLESESTLSAGLDLLRGEKGMFGASVGAGIAASACLLVLRRPILAYGDAMIPAVFAGYALARLGCLLGGCCFGTPTSMPWGIRYPAGSPAYLFQLHVGWIEPMAKHSLAVHPAPLYHAIAGLALYITTRRVYGKPGRPLIVALAGYGAARFVVEFFRGDGVPAWLGLDASHLASLLLLSAGLALWFFLPALAEITAIKKGESHVVREN